MHCVRIGLLSLVGLLPFAYHVEAQPPLLAKGELPKKLSPAAMQLLVSGVALYPDPVVTVILDAAQHPTVLHQAAQAATEKRTDPGQKRWPASVQTLSEKYPDVLAQLDNHLQLTTFLGLAYRAQPDDVWNAIEAVRQRIDQQLAKEKGSQPPAPADPSTPVAPSGSAEAPAPTSSYVTASTTVTGALLTAPAAQELGVGVVVVAPGASPAAVAADRPKDPGIASPAPAAPLTPSTPATPRTRTDPKAPSPYAQPNKQQIAAANQALDKNWGMLNQAKAPAAKTPGPPHPTPKGPRR